MRSITVKAYKPLTKDEVAGGVGPAPQLQWLPLTSLRVDDSYQRPIRADGVTHLRRIAMNFDWRLFAPVLVAPIEGGHYAVIDGQHRCHGAMLRGIEQVPCQVIVADQRQQARAFAALNGRQAIKLAPYQIHRAAVAAGNADARRVDQVLEAAGARIVHNIPSDRMERGDTVAVATIYKLIKTHGVEVATAAIEAIVKTADGHVGMLNALTLGAYAIVMAGEPRIREHPDLLDVLDDFDLQAAAEAARAASPKTAEQRDLLAAALSRFCAERLPQTAVTKGEAA